MKNLLQNLHRFGGIRPEDQAIGPVEIFDCATVGEEHGLRNDRALQTCVGETFFQPRTGANSHGSNNCENRRLGREFGNSQDNVVEVLGAVFGEKNHLCFAGEGFDVGGVSKASGAHVAADDLLKIFFKERNVALRHFHHARAIGMTTGNRGAKIRQTS